MEQRTRYGVYEAYTLDTSMCDGNMRKLIVHRHALPKLLEWPPISYYTLKGIPLEHPEKWSGRPDLIESDVEDFDFASPATVIPFHSCKKRRR